MFKAQLQPSKSGSPSPILSLLQHGMIGPLSPGFEEKQVSTLHHMSARITIMQSAWGSLGSSVLTGRICEPERFEDTAP